MEKGSKLLLKLKKRGKIQDYHIEAAAKFEKLVYCGFSANNEVKERVDLSHSPNAHLVWAGFQLARVPKHTKDVLMALLVYDMSLKEVGLALGETSKTSANRRGISEFCQALEVVAPLLD